MTKSQDSRAKGEYYFSMKQRTPFAPLFLAFAFLVAGSLLSPLYAEDTPVGTKLKAMGFYVFEKPQKLPEFLLPVPEGNPGSPIDSKKLSGSITLLNFWAPWCPPCRQEMPSIQRLHDAMQGYAFRIAAVCTGEKDATAKAFISREKYTFPVYMDRSGEIGRLLASQGIPTTYILDKDGKAIAGMVGAREYDDPELIALLKEMAEK